MKTTKVCPKVFMIPIFLALFLTASVTVSQATTLSGEWFFGGSDIQGNHTWDGSITVDNTGTITGGTLNSSAGPVYSITGGSLSVTSTGSVTGSFTDSSGVTTQFTMQMNAQKGIMAGEGNATIGSEDGVFIFVKKSSGFITYNLKGEWFFGGSDIQGNHTWDGSITVDNTGTITGGTLNSSAGPVYSITGGSLSVTSTGSVTGSFTDSSGVTTQFTMQMNAQKGIMAGEGNATIGSEDGVFIFVKKSSGFITYNLKGEWFFGGSDIQGNHTWDGSITVDNTGTITGGTLNNSAGPVYSITGGSLSVTSTGSVTGSFTDSSGVTTQFTMQMNAQKGIMAGEGNATIGSEDGVFIFVSCDSDSDELAVDFGVNGLYHYDGSNWTKLSNWNPDDNGMENWQNGLAVDFGGHGLYNYDGSSWTRPSSWNPEGMEGWANGLAVDFGSNGLYNYDGSSWTRLTPWNPEGDGMENWQHGLAVDFGSNGLYNYDGSSWTKLTGWNPDGMEGWANGLAVDFGGHGLYHFNGSTWTRLSSWNPEGMEGWANGLVVDFGSNGLYNYDGSSWTRLTGWNPEGMGGWANGLAVNFGANGLYHYDGSSWTKLSSWDSENGQAWGTDIAVDFGANGLFNYDGSNWTRLTGWNPEGMEDVDLN